MTTEPPALEARTIVSVVRRRWRVIVLVIAATVSVALALSLAQETRYRASTELLLSQPVDDQELGETARANEIQIIESGVVADAVEEELGVEADISVEAIEDSDVVSLIATHPDPAMAARISLTYAEVYLSERRQRSLERLGERRDELQARYDAVSVQLEELVAPLDELEAEIVAAPEEGRDVLEARRERLSDDIAAQRQSLVGQQASYAQQLNELLLAQAAVDASSGEILSAPEVPTDPYQPDPVRDVVSAALIGAFVALGLAFLRDRTDDRLKSSDEVREVTGLPVLGTVPDVGSSPTVLAREPEQIADGDSLVEAFRKVRTSVRFAAIEQPIRSIGVTSAESGEGKTMIALNLATALAWESGQVLLVEADLRRPSLARRLDLGRREGLADVLVGSASLQEAIWTPNGKGPAVLLAGDAPPNTAELLGSGVMQRLQETLAGEYDVVIYDLPPLLAVSDALVMSRQVDAVVLIASEKVSKRRHLSGAAELLRENGANTLGAVVNRSHVAPAYYGVD